MAKAIEDPRPVVRPVVSTGGWECSLVAIAPPFCPRRGSIAWPAEWPPHAVWAFMPQFWVLGPGPCLVIAWVTISALAMSSSDEASEATRRSELADGRIGPSFYEYLPYGSAPLVKWTWIPGPRSVFQINSNPAYYQSG